MTKKFGVFWDIFFNLMIKFFIASFFESVFRFNSSSALSNSSSWLLQLIAFKKVPTQDFDCKLLGNSAIVLVSGACQKYFLSVSIFSMSEVKVEKKLSPSVSFTDGKILVRIKWT